MADEKKLFKVEVKEVKGTCDNEIFKLLAENGDLQAEKVMEKVGEIFDITGIAKTHIITKDKEFDLVYYNTSLGFITSGSQVFLDSVEKYLGKITYFKIAEIKTKKGKTYKALPVLIKVNEEKNNKIEEII